MKSIFVMTQALVLGFGLSLSLADVDMKTIPVCATGSDDLGLKYTNNNLDAWDMRGYSMNIGAGKIQGKFFNGPSGNTLVAPGGTGTIFFQSCGGFTGTMSNKQLEAKTGSCNEPAPPKEPPSMACAEISAPASFYNPGQCLKDGLGVDRGDGYGGFIDSYQGQTQIQVAIPNTTVNYNGTAVRFDPASMGGPFYMMSMVALQEYLYVDMQFLLAMGASTSGAGLVNAAGASLYVSPANTGTDIAQYGAFKVTYQTAVGRLFKDYPKYFSGNPNMNKLVSTGGTGPTLANSPQQLNSGFLAAMNLWWLFDGLKAAQDLCFKQFLKDATDKSAGLKLMLGGYHIGPNVVDNGTGENDDYATHVLPTTNAALLGAADVTPYMKKFVWDKGGADFNTHNHISRVFTLLDQMVVSNTQSASCGGALPLYDAGITLNHVQELYFGQGGTATNQGNGGLLWHFNIPAAGRQALWTDLICAFDQLKGKAPGRAATEISFRYDLLTILRVARQHFSGYVNKFNDRPTPSDAFSSDWSIWVFNHSKVPCTRTVQDDIFPVLSLTDTSLRKGDKVEKSATDNVALKSREFSTDTDWRIWQPTDADFTVPATLTGTQRLWYRVTDSCGNSTIQEVPWKDTPPLPILPAPVATPPAGDYTKAQSVVLSVPDSVKTAAIHYTTDGSPPTAGSPKYSGPISITSNTTLKAIAILSGYQNSPQLIAVYTITIPPNAPVKSWYLDQNGDGSIETVMLTFAEDLSALPDRLGFKITDENGTNAERTAAGSAQIAFDGSNKRIKVTLADPFPFGITSVINAANSGQTFAQANIPLAAATFAVEDSVAPVILKGEVKEPDGGNPAKRVEITYSEEVVTVLPSVQPLVFKAEGGAEVPAAQVKIIGTDRISPRILSFHLDSGSVFLPVVGDSASIIPLGETTDKFGRAPAAIRFHRLEGNPPKTKPMGLFVTFPNGTKDKPSSGIDAGNQKGLLIPISSTGAPLPGSALGKCPSCQVGEPNKHIGPVIHVEIPLAGKYEFRIFSTLGEFLLKVEGVIEDTDLALLEKKNDAEGLRYVARFVWTGRDGKGAAAATGAYVLEGTFKFGRNPKTGALPSNQSRRTVFGLMR